MTDEIIVEKTIKVTYKISKNQIPEYVTDPEEYAKDIAAVNQPEARTSNEITSLEVQNND